MITSRLYQKSKLFFLYRRLNPRESLPPRENGAVLKSTTQGGEDSEEEDEINVEDADEAGESTGHDLSFEGAASAEALGPLVRQNGRLSGELKIVIGAPVIEFACAFRFDGSGFRTRSTRVLAEGTAVGA